MNIFNISHGAAMLTLGLGLWTGGMAVCAAQAKAEKQAAQLKIGDPLPKDAFSEVTWVQGDPVQSFDAPGKVYVLECWATWCGPCIAAIPHVNALHKKYADKGLVIIGMNVWEDGIEKTRKFVKKKGDGMAYRVAFSGGRKSAFADKVLKPAGVTGIPRALVVKDGKLILSIHPAKLDDPMIESLLDGSFDAAAHSKKEEKAAEARKAFLAKLRPMQKAGDWAGITNLADGLDDDNPSKFNLLMHAATRLNNWPDLIALRKAVADGRYGKRLKPSVVDTMVARNCEITEGAKAYAERSLADFQELGNDPKGARAAEYHFTKARMLYISGQTEAAKKELAAAKGWLKKIEKPNSRKFYARMILRAIKKVDKGSFPKLSRLLQSPSR